MKEFIGSMFCNACSAQADRLVDATSKKLRIHISTCQEVVKECNNAWNMIYTITHISNSYFYLSSALRISLTGNVVDFPVDLDLPETILDSGYISSLMREVAELRDNQELLNETSTVANLCNELLLFRRPFYELSSSGTVIERF